MVMMIAVTLLATTAAAAHVHVFNPSDECSGGKNPLGLLNPAGKDNEGTPQAVDSPAPSKCQMSR